MFRNENEMISTCAGRRIFPTLEYSINGLDPQKEYSMSIHIERVDGKRFRFGEGKWMELDSKEKITDPKKVFHRDGHQLGEKWMEKPISFDHIRITNRKSRAEGKPNYIYLIAQHRYIPILTIYEGDEIVHTARLEHTEFVPVTAYHNDVLGALKASNNHYTRKDRRRRIEQEAVVQVKKPKFSIESIFHDSSFIENTRNEVEDEAMKSQLRVHFNPFLLWPQFPILPIPLTSKTEEAIPKIEEKENDDEEEIDILN
uniref:T-box domain-containing protein n=2 Tax=Caenorhabditis tropicalis TaxID=1561998 RepID=A0A1I7UYD6_9PELO